MPYSIAQNNTDEKSPEHPIRLGQWRSVLNSQHGFFKESFIDEMAHADVEGGIVFALSAALLGEVTIEQGRVVEKNLCDYQMIRIERCTEGHHRVHPIRCAAWRTRRTMRAAAGCGARQRHPRR